MKSLVLLLIVWTPLAYVLYGSDTGGGVFSGESPYDGWIVGFLIFLGYCITLTRGRGLESKIIFAIFIATYVVVPIAVIEQYWGWSPAAWSEWNIAGVSILAFLSLLGCSLSYSNKKLAEEAARRGMAFSDLKAEKKKLKEDTEEANQRGISVEWLLKARKEEKAAAKVAKKADVIAKAATKKVKEVAEKAAKAAAAKKRREAKEAAAKKRREDRRELVRRYGEAVVDAFEKGRVCLDMPAEMVISIKGQPHEIKESVSKRGTRRQYIYVAKSRSGRTYRRNRQGNPIPEERIDFKDGLVTAIKDL